MKKKNILLRIISYFTLWRVILFAVTFIAGLLIVKFGNRFPYVDRVLSITDLPNWIWGFGNFDGVHYLRLAQNGYSAEYSQAFFPLFPILIRIFNFFPKRTLDTSLFVDPSFFYSGLILSNLFFVVALYFLYKLWKEEYKSKTANIAVLLLLTFPASFYFGSIYSESLFLLLAVLTFWFARKDKFFLAGIFAATASATKIQGAILFIFLIIELITKYKKRIIEKGKKLWTAIIGVLISPLGLLGYMYYLWRNFNDPIYFLNSQPAFGAARSSLPVITLPQVFYRYIKMLITVPPTNISFWISVLELFMTLSVIILLIYSYKKVKFSYWIFVALAIILPTLTGTLSSMPRYALLAFPLFPFIARFNRASKYIIIAQALLGILLLSFFIRGYWIA